MTSLRGLVSSTADFPIAAAEIDQGFGEDPGKGFNISVDLLYGCKSNYTEFFWKFSAISSIVGEIRE